MGMKIFRVLLILVVLLLAATGGAVLMHERILEWWAQRSLAERLASALGADVKIDGLGWNNGILRARQFRISGGDLPFSHLDAKELQTAATWRRLWEPALEPLSIEVSEAILLGSEEIKALPPPGSGTLPEMDILVASLSFGQPEPEGLSVKSSAVRALHKGGLWSLSARGGTVSFMGIPAMHIDRISAERRGDSWKIMGFALNDGNKGALAGSAAKPSDARWSAEFSWQDLDLAPLMRGAASHFEGIGSGDATLKNGVLQGRLKVVGAATKEVPSLVKMASLFAGENWDVIPWETLSFDFKRGPDGTTAITNFQAVSSKGLVVNGSGTYRTDALRADLQLGVLRQGRPWLVAFMPVLFRNERDGYMWTSVRVGGTPEAPTEDLSARVVAALASAPATGAIEAATDIPATAVEAAGQLLKGVFGN